MKTFAITALLAVTSFANSAQALTPIYRQQEYQQLTQTSRPGYSANTTCPGRPIRNPDYSGTSIRPTSPYSSSRRPFSQPQPPYFPTSGSQPKSHGPSPVTPLGGMPWGQPPAAQSGSNPWGQPPAVQTTGVPQQLQGIWFDVSPEGNLWTYVIRANSYDMFEVDPRTNQQVVIDGQPVQVVNGPLTFANGVLHLSPGADVEEGPFNTAATPDATQLVLQSLNGEAPRSLTRQRQI